MVLGAGASLELPPDAGSGAEAAASRAVRLLALPLACTGTGAAEGSAISSEGRVFNEE